MTKHRGTFEFCSGWDAGAEAQNKKIQEVIQQSRQVAFYVDDSNAYQYILHELEELIGDSDE